MTPCKDCRAQGLVNKRPAIQASRCATHHRAAVKARRAAAREKRVQAVYSLTAAEYDEIYQKQGTRCAICTRANGTRKRLAVDHDHSCCNGPTSCGRCVRGLLCGSCNKMLGFSRDDPEFFRRAADYLERWPSGRGPERPDRDDRGAAAA